MAEETKTVRICDRCGHREMWGGIPPTGDPWVKLSARNCDGRNVVGDDDGWADDQFDLCENCVKKFRKWWASASQTPDPDPQPDLSSTDERQDNGAS